MELKAGQRQSPANVVRRSMFVPALLLLVAGCSGDSEMLRADWKWWSSSAPQSARPAASDQLVGQDGACAETVQARGIALGMTECELVRSLGPTQNIQIAANERGERTAVIVYPAGDRAGSYNFRSGQLVAIEAVAPPPAPPRAAKKPRKKTPPPQRQGT